MQNDVIFFLLRNLKTTDKLLISCNTHLEYLLNMEIKISGKLGRTNIPPTAQNKPFLLDRWSPQSNCRTMIFKQPRCKEFTGVCRNQSFVNSNTPGKSKAFWLLLSVRYKTGHIKLTSVKSSLPSPTSGRSLTDFPPGPSEVQINNPRIKRFL